MAINKVNYGNTTLIDLTSDTVVADKLLSGYTAHNRSGEVITGTHKDPLVVTLEWDNDYFGSSGAWIPNKTFAEIQAAYTAGKTIVFNCDAGIVEVSAEGAYIESESRVEYWTRQFRDDVTSHMQIYETEYHFDSNGVRLGETFVYDDTESTTLNSPAQMLLSVSAISNHVLYRGSIPTKTSSDLTASGATVTVPSGYYASQATKTVASGTEGTPTATKGTVSNNAVTVSPSVTNTAGYISGGTHTGTAVTVTASELVDDGDDVAYGTMVDDLTGTTWEFNVTDPNFEATVLNLNTPGKDYALSGSYEYRAYDSQSSTSGTFGNRADIGVDISSSAQWVSIGSAYPIYVSFYGTPKIRASYAKISITGGTDAANSNLIFVLYKLATRIS